MKLINQETVPTVDLNGGSGAYGQKCLSRRKTRVQVSQPEPCMRVAVEQRSAAAVSLSGRIVFVSEPCWRFSTGHRRMLRNADCHGNVYVQIAQCLPRRKWNSKSEWRPTAAATNSWHWLASIIFSSSFMFLTSSYFMVLLYIKE